MDVAIRKEQNYYYSIDIAKFICAILVIAIHSAPFGSDALILNYSLKHYIARIAVPFFFVASGFFYFKSNDYHDYNTTKAKKYLARLFFLYAFWCLVYFPYHIDACFKNSKGMVHGVLIYLKSFVFEGGHFHLWYVISLFFAILILSIFIKCRMKINHVLVISVVLYCIGLLGQGYSFLLNPLREYSVIWNALVFIKKIIGTTRNGLFEGLLFVTMGLILATYKNNLASKKNLLLFFFSMIGVGFEILFIHFVGGKIENDFYIFLAPAVWFLFLYVSRIKLKANSTCVILRKMSSLMYFGHILVKDLVEYIMKSLALELKESCLPFVLTVVLSTLFSYLIVKLSGVNGFKWLKKLY